MKNINKSVVVKTNHSDRHYISTTIKNMKTIRKSIKEDGFVNVNIYYYTTIDDKKNNIISKMEKIKIKNITRLGVRNKSNNGISYRFKMS